MHRIARFYEQYRRQLALVLTPLLIAGVLPTALFALPASANTPPHNTTVGGFEIDGNLYNGYANTSSTCSTSPDVKNTGPDWCNVLAGPTATDPAAGTTTDNDFSGSKESDNPLTWVGGGSLSSPKDDVLRMYVHSDIYPDPSTGHLWGQFGVERASSSGTTYFDFELNQLGNQMSTSKSPISVPTRSTANGGDVLITAQVQGTGPLSVAPEISRWIHTTNPGTDCAIGSADANGDCWSVQVPLDPSAFAGESNDSTVTSLPASDGTIGSGQFTEMAIDLTAVGATLGCPSAGFTQINVRTRSSISLSSELKDNLPAPVDIPSACGAMVIKKFGPDGTTLVPGATYSISPNPTPGAPASPPLVVTDGGTGDADGAANGVVVIAPAVPTGGSGPASYSVTEQAPPAGYLFPTSGNPVTGVTVDKFSTGDTATPVTFTDPLASISWTKTDAVTHQPLCGATFTLTQNTTLKVNSSGTGTTSVSSPTISPNPRTVTTCNSTTGVYGPANNLYAGTYTLAETAAPAGYADPTGTHVDVSIDQNGVVTYSGASNSNVTIGTGAHSVSFSNPHLLSTLWVQKTDATGTNGLAGAVFNLYQEKVSGTENPSVDTFIGTCTTTGTGLASSGAGKCSVGNLDWGGNPYYWVEITPPAGYNLPDQTNEPVPGITITSSNAGTTFPVTVFADTQSAIVTTATANATLSGSPATATISDSAVLSGVRSTAGGTITFKLYAPNDPTCSATTPLWTSAAFPVSGPGTYGPATHVVTAAGTYRWIASYSGDTNNQPVSGTCGDLTNGNHEQSVVAPATPTIVTTATDATLGPNSVTIHDTATLSGGTSNIGGTLTFNAYGPFASAAVANCNGTPAYTSIPAVTVSGNGTYGSGNFTVTEAGTYVWQVVYSGDGSNGTVTTVCGDTSGDNHEVSVVSPATPSIVTTATNATLGPNPVTISDSGVLSGATADAGGTLTFNAYGPFSSAAAANCNGTPAYSTNPADTVSGNGTYSSGDFTVTQAGTYVWQAVYSGDANNVGFTSVCGDTSGDNHEVSVVSPATPGIVTSATNVTLGPDPVTIHDSGTLSGATADAGGTLTFNAYGPFTSASTASCDGTPAYTSTPAVPVSGNGVYDSGNFTVTQAGTYVWQVVYSGDGNNVGFTSVCGDTSGENNEVSVVSPATPGIVTTASDATPNPPNAITISDSGTVTGGTSDMGGTLTFNAYGPFSDASAVDCTGTPAASSAPITVNGDGIYNSGDLTVSGAGLYAWQVVYSGDANNTPFTSVCGDMTDPNKEISVVNSAGLTLVKAVNTATATFGDTLTYTLTATATGTTPVQHNVTVHDVVPTGTTYVDASAACIGTPCVSASYDAATNTVTWVIGDMNTNTSRQVTFKAKINPAGPTTPTTILNSGTVVSAETATTPSNQVKTTITVVAGVKTVKPAQLPFTGAPLGILSTVALILFGTGATLLVSTRRRRGRHGELS